MKKVILFAAVFAAFTFASCKKEHDCKCTTTYTPAGGTAGTPSTTTTHYDKISNKQAKTLCQSSKTTDDFGNVSNETCELEKD